MHIGCTWHDSEKVIVRGRDLFSTWYSRPVAVAVGTEATCANAISSLRQPPPTRRKPAVPEAGNPPEAACSQCSSATSSGRSPPAAVKLPEVGLTPPTRRTAYRASRAIWNRVSRESEGYACRALEPHATHERRGRQPGGLPNTAWEASQRVQRLPPITPIHCSTSGTRQYLRPLVHPDRETSRVR